MTIIISVGQALVADRIISVGDHGFWGAKIYRRKNMIWGCAGPMPSPAMLAATDLDQFRAAFATAGVASNRAGPVVQRTRDSGVMCWNLYWTEGKDRVAACEANNIETGYAVGCYHPEWLAYSSGSAGRGPGAAIDLAETVHRLRGREGVARVESVNEVLEE